MKKKFHYIDDNNYIFSERNMIILDKHYKKILKVNEPSLLLPNIIKRLLRIDIHLVKYTKDVLVVFIKNRILLYPNNIKSYFEINIDRGVRPLRQCVELLDNKIYYGDYWANVKREPVNIYQIDLKTFKKKIFYSFYEKRHIHFIQKDELNDNKILIGTGDNNNESGLYQLDLITKDIRVLAEGCQKYRAVSILQLNSKLFWGSDNPDGINYIFMLDRKTNKIKKICSIEGPAYYSTINKKGDMFIGTTVENRRKHIAVIYISEDKGFTWKKFKEFKKDIWHTKYFGYGIIEFIDGQETLNKLIYNLVGLKEI